MQSLLIRSSLVLRAAYSGRVRSAHRPLHSTLCNLELSSKSMTTLHYRLPSSAVSKPPVMRMMWTTPHGCLDDAEKLPATIRATVTTADGRSQRCPEPEACYSATTGGPNHGLFIVGENSSYQRCRQHQGSSFQRPFRQMTRACPGLTEPPALRPGRPPPLTLLGNPGLTLLPLWRVSRGCSLPAAPGSFADELVVASREHARDTMHVMPPAQWAHARQGRGYLQVSEVGAWRSESDIALLALYLKC